MISHMDERSYDNEYLSDSDDICKILVIDDDSDFVDELSQFVEALGYVCITAGTAQDGLKALTSDTRIGVILCDVVLPMIDGTEFVRQAWFRYRETRPLVTVLLTGHANYALALEALRLGVDDLLTKPIQSSEIARILRDGVAHWRQRRQAIEHATATTQQSKDSGASASGESTPANTPLLTGDISFEDLAGFLLYVNRERNRLLQTDLFGDPAWDITLDLARAKLNGTPVPVSSACTASNAPLTTSLRWVRNMQTAGKIQRWNDPKDKRRDLVELSDEFFDELRAFFARIQPKWRDLVAGKTVT